jgi:DNA-binding CsgD family transcriptional regulator
VAAERASTAAARRLIGRTEECAVLEAARDDVRRGESRSLVLRGEAGIGKTALLEHLVERAPDMTIARAAGVEPERVLAFAGLHHLCGPMLGALPRLPDPQRQALEAVFGLGPAAPPDRFLVALGALGLLTGAAGERPLLCVVDDAQWLDRPSALTLGFVARRLLGARVGIVIAARESVRELQHLAELEVRGLRDADARRLLGSAARATLDERVRARILAEARGNPEALLEATPAPRPAGALAPRAARQIAPRDEQDVAGRLAGLADDVRRLALLAAAEPVGDPLLVWRAAARLGIEPAAAEPAEALGLLAIGERVSFRDPRVRSAVYRSATPRERRAAHRALAEVTEGGSDADRRAWHLAAAAEGPDEDVASALERSAGRAQARGGLPAAAAVLARAVALTPDPARRAERAPAAARAHLRAGAFAPALELLATAEAGPIDERGRARAALLRAEVAFASGRGAAAPGPLLRAARRVEPVDGRLARAGALQALSAARFAARLAGPGAGPREVAEAVRAAPAGGPSAADLLLRAWATRLAEGGAAATPELQHALARFADAGAGADDLPGLWLATVTAPAVWDDERWDALSRSHVALARGSGALGELPLGLHARSLLHLLRGELETAGELLGEARAAVEATGAGLTPWGDVALAALRGCEHEAAAVFEGAAAGATARGEGIGLTVVHWARAVLSNGLRAHDRAFAAAREAIDCPAGGAVSTWALAELAEAAARVGEHAAAHAAAERLAAVAEAAGTDWALGIRARSCAVVSAGPAAERAYREALDRLARRGLRVDLARTQLLYGEWLRGAERRVDARAQLRDAHEAFAAMGMEGFAERARDGLAATGAKVANAGPAAPVSGLTAQEREIALLVHAGLSNPEIGARLFLSPRTVEWHLHKVFAKLGIRSRRELADAVPGEAVVGS